MPDLSKLQKIRISLTILWVICTALISGFVAKDYSYFNFLTFIGALVFLNLPTLLYWLGCWIWGGGFLFKVIAWPFKKILTHRKVEREISTQPPKNKIAGFFIPATSFLFALLIVSITSNEQRMSTAYLFGETLGFFIVFGFLALLFLRKNHGQARQTIVLSVIFCLSAIFTCYPLYKEARDARYAAISVADAIEKEYIAGATAKTIDDIKTSSMEVPETNKMAPLINLLSQSREKTLAIFIDYANSFPAGFENTITPETLSNINSIHLAKKNINQVLSGIPDYKDRIEIHIKNLEDGIQSLHMEQTYKDSAIKGFLKSKDTSLAEYYQYFSIQEGMLRDFLSLLTLMENAYGTYEYDDSGNIYFAEDRHIEAYNELMTSITNYALLEKEWGERMVAKDLSAAKKMREQFGE